MTIEHLIKAEAERLGFTISGITTPDPPVSFPRYKSWIESGHHAGMDYLATPRASTARANPRTLLSECQSILVLGIPYARPPVDAGFPEGHSPFPLTGKIAAYAWGEDYHNIITPRLEKLAKWLQNQLDMKEFSWKGYTDTGPILEHDLAMRAGLGWIGRNTNMIHPRKGSYFFLAELLLPVTLQPDEPFEQDRCGSCQRCIQACPTGCILPDRTIDAARCISYLTIENKADIPVNLRPGLGNMVFGCDICQSVCPWNNKSTRAKIDPIFHPDPIHPGLDLHTVFDLSPQEFNTQYSGSPLKRAKRRGILRNCAVVLGNFPHSTHIPVLKKVLTTEFEPLVRGHAAWALGNIRDQKAVEALKEALQTENDLPVLTEIRNALNQLK
jgi:epoxyqueuosine reductase